MEQKITVRPRINFWLHGSPLNYTTTPHTHTHRFHKNLTAEAITIFSWSGSNSLTMVVSILSDFCVCNSLLPSWVMTDLALRPSKVSSSNSSPNLNEIDEFLNVELDDSTYFSSLLVSSTTGDTLLPTFRVNKPTPM